MRRRRAVFYDLQVAVWVQYSMPLELSNAAKAELDSRPLRTRLASAVNVDDYVIVVYGRAIWRYGSRRRREGIRIAAPIIFHYNIARTERRIINWIFYIEVYSCTTLVQLYAVKPRMCSVQL